MKSRVCGHSTWSLDELRVDVPLFCQRNLLLRSFVVHFGHMTKPTQLGSLNLEEKWLDVQEVTEKNAPATCAFTHVSLFCMAMITLVCQSFGALPEHQATWHTLVSQRTPSPFQTLYISGRISSQLPVFPALSVLTSRGTSTAVTVFSTPNVPRVCSVV